MKIGYVKHTFKYFQGEQKQALIDYGCDQVYIHQINNSNCKIIDNLKSGDTLVVYKFIVLASSIQELLQVLKIMYKKGVNVCTIKPQFYSHNNIKLEEMLLILSEFLEDIRYQKQQMGIVKAKFKGKHIGRPRKLTKKQLLKALDMKQYKTSLQVANQLKVSKSTLLRNLGEMKKTG